MKKMGIIFYLNIFINLVIKPLFSVPIYKGVNFTFL